MCCYGIKTFLFFLEIFKEDMRYCNECCLICRLRFSTIFGSSKIKIFGWNNCAIFLIKWCWRISIGLNLETSGVDVLLLKPRKDGLLFFTEWKKPIKAGCIMRALRCWIWKIP